MVDRTPSYRANKRRAKQFGNIIGNNYNKATGRSFSQVHRSRHLDDQR